MARARAHRRSSARILAAAAAVAAFLGLAAGAGAAQIDVFFDGPSLMDEIGDPSNFGLSLQQVESLGGAVEVRDDLIVAPLGDLAVVNQALQSFDPNPTKATGNRASSLWTIRNNTAEDLLAPQFLLFTHTDSFVKNGTRIDYDDAIVGISIDPDDGWLIVRAQDDALGDFYYPAKRLVDGVFGAGSDVALLVNYVADTPLLDAPAASQNYQLHELQLGRASAVPEPGTGMLLAAGVIGLAARRRRRD